MNRPALIATRLVFAAMVGVGTIGLWLTNIVTDTRSYEARIRRGRYEPNGIEARDG